MTGRAISIRESRQHATSSPICDASSKITKRRPLPPQIRLEAKSGEHGPTKTNNELEDEGKLESGMASTSSANLQNLLNLAYYSDTVNGAKVSRVPRPVPPSLGAKAPAPARRASGSFSRSNSVRAEFEDDDEDEHVERPKAYLNLWNRALSQSTSRLLTWLCAFGNVCDDERAGAAESVNCYVE